MPKCLIKGCPHKTGEKVRYPDVILHTFPRNLERVKQWLMQTGHEFADFENFTSQVLEDNCGAKFRVCSNHFTEDCYTTTGKRKILKESAIPTTNLQLNASKVVERNMFRSTKRLRLDSPEASTAGELSVFPSKKSLDSPQASTVVERSVFPSIKRIDGPQASTVVERGVFPSIKRIDGPQASTVVERSVFPSIKRIDGPQASTVVERSRFRPIKSLDSPEAYRSMKLSVQASKVRIECGVNTEIVEKRDVCTQTENNFFPFQSAKNVPVMSEHSYGMSEPFHDRCTSNKDSTSASKLQSNDSVLCPFQLEDDQQDSEDIEPAKSSSTSDKSTVVKVPSRSSGVFEPVMRALSKQSLTSVPGLDPEDTIVSERKFVVFEKCLDRLLRKQFCGAGVGCVRPVLSYRKHVRGSFLFVIGVCQGGHSFLMWESQPMILNIPAGDVLFSASLLFSGSNFTKVEEMNTIFGIQQISETTFLRYQKLFLFPVIHHEWQEEKKKVKESLLDRAVCVGGDGQCDNPGHSAKYCVYTMMDLVSQCVIDFEVTQLGQGSSSVALEIKAFEISIQRLIEDNYNVPIIATDRRVSIRKILREKYPHIKHQFDTWHYAKRLRKKLVAASKNKFCSKIGFWTDAIINHFWWSSRTCNYDVELLKHKWESVLKHVINVHEWRVGDTYHRCEHKELPEELVTKTLWLKNDTLAFETLAEIIQSPQIIKDLVHLTHFCHSGAKETFHSHVLKFRPKRIHFSNDAMYARTALAVLAHNNHLKREQAVVQISPQKRTVGNAYESMTKRDEHIHVMMQNVVRLCKSLSTEWTYFGDTVTENIDTAPCPGQNHCS